MTNIIPCELTLFIIFTLNECGKYYRLAPWTPFGPSCQYEQRLICWRTTFSNRPSIWFPIQNFLAELPSRWGDWSKYDEVESHSILGALTGKQTGCPVPPLRRSLCNDSAPREVFVVVLFCIIWLGFASGQFNTVFGGTDQVPVPRRALQEILRCS